VYPLVLKMETLILASHDSPNWSIVSILAWKQITLLSINVEFNFSGFNVNVGICGTQEGSPKNERCLYVLLHIKYYKIYRNKKVLDFYRNILSNSYRVEDWLVG
jgi:hypothetical protein